MNQHGSLVTLSKCQSIDIEFRDVSYSVAMGFRKSKKTILKSLSGSFKSGELTALMGPSGAGKSSLMNILTGFQTTGVTGTMSFGKSNLACDWKKYKKYNCYIQQEDRLHNLFSVNEVMHMAADLKLSNDLSACDKRMIISNVLQVLDLIRVQDNRCNQLSGGQRKRLSIALELIDNPPVMFLDEPTTGLDSSTSFQMISLLKDLARSGRTVVCTIHQPSASIFEVFDHVYCLAQGQCVYQGEAVNVVSHFAKLGLVCPKYHNPADFMMEVITEEHGDHNEKLLEAARLVKRRGSAVTGPKLIEDLKIERKTSIAVRPPSELSRYLILMKRYSIHLTRDWTSLPLKVVLHVLVSLAWGLIFRKFGNNGSKVVNNCSYLMIVCFYASYINALPAVLRFPEEYHVLKKENFNNWYKLRTYYLAYLSLDIPFQVFYTFIYCSISYLLTGQPMEIDRFAMFWLVTILCALNAESCGLLIGSLMNTLNGIFLTSTWFAAAMNLAGFLVFLSHMPVFLYYVSFLNFVRYAFESIVLSVYGFGREKIPCPTGNQIKYCPYQTPSMLIKELSMDETHYWSNILILIANFMLVRLGAFFTLKRKLQSA